MVCRAGPVCPAAGRQQPFSTGRLVPLCRAGACTRRRAALPTTTGVGAGIDAMTSLARRRTLPTTTGVGAGIPDGPGWGAQKGRRPPPRDGVGTAALRLTPWRLRHLRMALWDDWGVRAVRGAGISPAAAGGSFAPCAGRPGALPPGPLRFFEKNRVKLLSFFTRRGAPYRDGGTWSS